METYIEKAPRIQAIRYNPTEKLPTGLRHAWLQSKVLCGDCTTDMALHAFIEVTGQVVCPGEWVIFPEESISPPHTLSNAAFAATYMKASLALQEDPE